MNTNRTICPSADTRAACVRLQEGPATLTDLSRAVGSRDRAVRALKTLSGAGVVLNHGRGVFTHLAPII